MDNFFSFPLEVMRRVEVGEDGLSKIILEHVFLHICSINKFTRISYQRENQRFFYIIRM